MAKIYGRRWQIIDNIGEGGQAHAFRVRDLNDGSENWVLKRLKNDTRIARFEREINALAALGNLNIPRVIEYSLEGDPFYVIPHLGIDLEKFNSNNTFGEGDSEKILSLIFQITSAVNSAHNVGIVHRDIKPNNVIVSDDETRAYLIDFGICQYSDGTLSTLTLIDEPLGNPAFSAPECHLGAILEPGPPSGVYSLGKLIYWTISSGNNIFRENVDDNRLDLIIFKDELIKSFFKPLIYGTLKGEPSQRWSCQELLEEVEQARKLVLRLRAFRERGYVVIEDRFGVDDEFNETSCESATTAPQGNPPGDHSLAISFQLPAAGDAKLDAVFLVLSRTAGDGHAELHLVPDANGSPHPNEVIEAFSIVAASRPSVQNLCSAERPMLRASERYWLVLSIPEKGGRVALWGARSRFQPRPALIAHRFENRNWESRFSPNGPGYAVRVLGRPA